MTDTVSRSTGRRRENPAEVRTTTYQIEGHLYQIQQGPISFVIRRQRTMTVPGKGEVPYWHTVTNHDEVVMVLKAI